MLRPRITTSILLSLILSLYLVTPVFAFTDYKESNQLVKSRDYTGAIKCLDQIIHKSPKNRTALFCRGNLYYALGNYPAAIHDFEQYLLLEHNKTARLKTYVRIAKCYADMGQINEAIEKCNEAIKTRTSRDLYIDDAYALRGQYYLSQGKYELARSDLNKAIDLGNNKNATESLRWLNWLQTNKLIFSTLKEKPLSLPFQYLDGQVVIQANINEKENVLLLVDTGVFYSTVFRQKADKLRLKTTKLHRKARAREGKIVLHYPTTLDSLSFDGLKFTGVPVTIANPKTVVKGADGVLGNDFLSQFLITIDFYKKTITFQNPESKVFADQGIHIPMTFAYLQCPFLQATLDGKDPMKFLIDIAGTENDLPLSLKLLHSEAFLCPDIPFFLEGTTGGSLDIIYSYCKSFTVGPLIIPDIEFSTCINDDLNRYRSYGVISNHIWSRFILSLDYRHNMLILEKPSEIISNDQNLRGVALLPPIKCLLLDNKQEEAKTIIQKVIDGTKDIGTLLCLSSFCNDESLPDLAQLALKKASGLPDLSSNLSPYYTVRIQQQILLKDFTDAQNYVDLALAIKKSGHYPIIFLYKANLDLQNIDNKSDLESAHAALLDLNKFFSEGQKYFLERDPLILVSAHILRADAYARLKQYKRVLIECNTAMTMAEQLPKTEKRRLQIDEATKLKEAATQALHKNSPSKKQQ